MDYIGNLVLIMTGLSETYMCYMFFTGFFKKREHINNRKIIISYLITSLAVYCINITGYPTLNLCVVPLILITFLFYIFKGKNIAIITMFVICFSVMLAGEFIATIFIELSGEAINVETVANSPYLTLNCKLISFIILLVIRQLTGTNRNIIINKVFWVYMLIPIASVGLMMTSFYIGEQVPYSNYKKLALTLSCGFMLFSNIAIFIGFNAYSENLQKSMEKELEVRKEKANSQYYKKLVETEENRKMLIHDMKHYLIGLRSIIESGDSRQAIELLDGLDGKITSNETAIYTDVPILDGMLTEKNVLAKENQVELNIYVDKQLDFDRIPQVEYMVILSNLIDNAIRAAKDCREKGKVSVTILERNNHSFLISKVENIFEPAKIRKEKGKLISTKKEKGIHGIGLNSVEKMAESIGGVFTTEIKDNIFSATLMLQENHNHKS